MSGSYDVQAACAIVRQTADYVRADSRQVPELRATFDS